MRFAPREKGQGLVEYSMVIILIAIVVIVILALVGTQVSTLFSQISSGLSST